MEVVIDQSYGMCTKQLAVPVTDGYFQSAITPMSDSRSFYSKIRLTSTDYLKIEQNYPFSSFIQDANLYVGIQTVNLAERTLGGVYSFKVIDALSYEPIRDMVGQYTLGTSQNGDWTSTSTGEVHLDGLRTGLTNI